MRYNELLATIKQKIQDAQVKTVMAANSQMLWLYWQLGNSIIQNQNQQGWGAKIIDLLATDLKREFPFMKGFSNRNMFYMKQFAEAYPPGMINVLSKLEQEVIGAGGISQQVVAKLSDVDNQFVTILQQPVAELGAESFLNSIIARISWSHHVVLITKVKSTGKRFWYMMQCLESGMSRNILAIQIENGLFERQLTSKKVNNFSRTLPASQTDFANYLLKDPYIFDFVQAKEQADERNIEGQLTEHITKFLLELGQGFAFMGKQVHFEMGKQDFYVDLLFYHTKLHAYVVVELKAREFEPGDVGQLNFYINLINDKLKNSGDNDTIGLLLCRGKNEVLAEYAIKNINQPIGVSDYQFGKAVPKDLQSQLPDISDLENELLKESGLL